MKKRVIILLIGGVASMIRIYGWRFRMSVWEGKIGTIERSGIMEYESKDKNILFNDCENPDRSKVGTKYEWEKTGCVVWVTTSWGEHGGKSTNL